MAKKRKSTVPAQSRQATAAPPRIARVAKGKRPQYFSDPAIDKLLSMTVSLMEELSVTRDRLDTVERLLERKRVLRRADIENYQAPAPAQQERAARRAAFVERVMRVVQAELEEVTRADMPQSTEEIVAAVAN